jgi:hypothetical protein
MTKTTEKREGCTQLTLTLSQAEDKLIRKLAVDRKQKISTLVLDLVQKGIKHEEGTKNDKRKT